MPSYLGERLVNSTMEMGKKNIQLVRFGAELGLRHRYIYRAPGIEEIVLAFVQKTELFRENMGQGNGTLGHEDISNL